jgi:adenylate cyclase
VLGNVGSENRMDYTVVGDCVNVASRFEQLAKGGDVIVGEDTYKSAGDGYHMEELEEVQLKNKNKPVKCYTLSY